MRFKLKTNDSSKHTELCTAATWTLGNDVYSISDDKTIVKWDTKNGTATKFMELEDFPTDIEWLPQSKGVNELFAVAFSDGSFKLITKLAKVDKVVANAHNGAIICLKWSNDGQALATAGEDGQIKIWSRTGNLRSQLIQHDKPIYSICWSPENDSLLYCSDKNLFIKQMQAGTKQVQWKAHEGIVLKVDWNPANNLIISGGEDCRFKIWDSYGRLTYASNPYDYVITSLGWAPNGEYFAVGAYDMIRLCDKSGWTYSFQKSTVGSLLKLSWSSDSTICAGAAGNGDVLYASIVDRSLTYENWELTLAEDNKIHVNDLLNELSEELDFKDRVINLSLCYNNLIVTTTTHCYIYPVTNWNTPVMFDLKEPVSMIIQSPKYFCLVDVVNGLMIYNYEGKMISNPKIPGIKYEVLNRKKLSLSQDLLALIDATNNKMIKFFDVMSGKQTAFVLDHVMEISEIHLNKTEVSAERKIAFVDSNRDLFLCPTHKKDVIKLCSMSNSFMWNDKNDILVTLSDGKLMAWYYPNAIYVDKDIMDQCKIMKELPDIGRVCQITSFSNSMIVMRRRDGGLITITLSPYPSLLFEFCDKGKWDKAIRLCRYVKESTLWACLAAYSLYSRELRTADIALAAIEAVDKVQYINHIENNLQSTAAKSAALSLYFHKFAEAEHSLLQAKLFYRAIKLNIKLFKWERALELALQHKVHLDTVMAYRKRYLEFLGREESNKKFQKYFTEFPELNWTDIKAKIKKEKEAEAKAK